MVNKLGEYLRQLRGKESLRDVARRSNGNLSHGFISTAERGIGTNGAPYVPSPEKLRAFANVYNVSYNHLMQLAGYADLDNNNGDIDEIDLERMLESNIQMTCGGEELSNEEKQRVKDILTGIFWEKTHKERGSNEK